MTTKYPSCTSMYLDLQHPPPGVDEQLEAVERLLGLRGVMNAPPRKKSQREENRERTPLEYFSAQSLTMLRNLAVRTGNFSNTHGKFDQKEK